MTIQNKLSTIWAINGSVADFGDVNKYGQGWVTEIPFYENFNYVLQNLSKNILVLAEEKGFQWQDDINYKSGAIAIRGDREFYCSLDNINQDPDTDTTNSFWRLSQSWGQAHTYSAKVGAVNNAMFSRNPDFWLGQDQTIIGSNNSLILFADQTSWGNMLFGVVKGELVTKYVGNVVEPNGSNILPQPEGGTSTNVSHRIYHEGYPPKQEDIVGSIPEAPDDSHNYVRGQKEWHISSGGGSGTIPSGSRMLFAMAAAPDGWLQDKSDTSNNRMLRVVSNTGGGQVGGTDDPILNNKVPSHVHRSWMNASTTRHSHEINLNSNGQSAGHHHNIDITSTPNNKAHTHGRGSYVTNTVGNHTHDLGMHAKVTGPTLNGVSISTYPNEATGGPVGSAGGGSHSHSVSGYSATQSTDHTHRSVGATGWHDADHFHQTHGNSKETADNHAHTGGLAYLNINETINYDYTDQGGLKGSYTQTNTGDWKPKYLNLIICTAN